MNLKDKIKRKIEEAEKAGDFERVANLKSILKGLDDNVPKEDEEYF